MTVEQSEEFKKWGKKGASQVFGVFKGFIGGLFNTFKGAVSSEKPKTEDGVGSTCKAGNG